MQGDHRESPRKEMKKLEACFKGIANHRRIEILLLVQKSKGITLDQIATKLNCNLKTVSEHTRRLVQADLLEKCYHGQCVAHFVSHQGRKMISFIESL
ncbi:MAG TPA: winged helix-turn-helix domain-containing protein [Candidatus Paceibacterota bacterium]|nr:winged helix-turn-helix domain-containing protein [Candidatus Paceibacterota bacterium]